jgi:hypothetical protein
VTIATCVPYVRAMRASAIVLASACCLAAAGCGGARGTVVEVSATDLGSGQGTIDALPHAHANGREVPLASVLPLVPSPLPVSGSDCTGIGSVAITFSNGRRVRYGRCRPRAISLLQAALTGEARQWAAPAVAHARIVGARPAEARELRALLRAMGTTRISSIGIEPDGAEVRLRVHAGESVRGEWEAGLLSARYTNAAGRGALRPVGVFAGSDTTLARGFVARPFSLARVHRAVVTAIGGRARLLELRNEGGGLAVVVRTDDPATFLKRRGRALAAAAAQPARYVGVEDATGAVVYAWAGLPFEGIVYPRPDLDGCGPIVHSTPALSRPWPCHAR